jgi:hypothetical protein
MGSCAAQLGTHFSPHGCMSSLYLPNPRWAGMDGSWEDIAPPPASLPLGRAFALRLVSLPRRKAYMVMDDSQGPCRFTVVEL